MSTPNHWFVSDTHFCTHRPEHIEAFKLLCLQIKPGDSLLLLGDIFEFWISETLAQYSDLEIQNCLKRCAEKGVHVYFMHGNRDFMVRESFTKRTGAQLLPDPSVWILPNGDKAILTHGDWFCTDEKAYRIFRAIVRNRFVQSCFLSLHHTLQVKLAKHIRSSSQHKQQKYDSRSYDAHQDLIDQYYEQHPTIKTIIMGHTHRPKLHVHGIRKRLVLGDWRDTLWYGIANKNHGMYLFESSLDLSQTELKAQL